MVTAEAQSKMNRETAVTQANLNRINQYTPQGSLTYSQKTGADGKPVLNEDGTPQWEQTQKYSTDEQTKYDQNNKVAIALNGLANNNIDRVNDAQSKAFSYDGMTPLQTSVNPSDLVGIRNIRNLQQGLDYSGLTKLPGTSDFGAEQQRMADSVYGQATSRLDPQWQQSNSDLKSSLAAQGISENSDAYRRAMDNQSRAQNDAYNQATFSAQQAGSEEQSRLFGLALGARQQGQSEVENAGNFYNQAQQQTFTQQAQRAAVDNQNDITRFNQQAANATLNNQGRQQQIQEATYLRNMPINDIAALLGTGAGVQDPTFNQFAQVGVASPDYMGAVNNNYNQAMNQYNQAQANKAQGLGSIFGAAGSLGSAAIMMSDMRFKENIERVGTLANGLPTYSYNYIGDNAKQFGVMAQEAAHVVPEAVGVLPSGIMYVDYRKVF